VIIEVTISWDNNRWHYKSHYRMWNLWNTQYYVCLFVWLLLLLWKDSSGVNMCNEIHRLMHSLCENSSIQRETCCSVFIRRSYNEQLQSLTAEFNISETCYLTHPIHRASNPRFSLKWFTHVTEVYIWELNWQSLYTLGTIYYIFIS